MARYVLILLLSLLLFPLASWNVIAQIDKKDKKDGTVPDGLKALKDPDAKVRYQSAQILANLGAVAKFAAPALRDALKDEKVPSVRVKIAEALWKIEKPPVKVVLPTLVDALRDKEVPVRVGALMVLGQIGKDAKTAVPAITLAVKDKDLGVRMEAVITLGEIGPAAKTAIPELFELLRGSEDVLLLEPLVTVTLANIGASGVAALCEALTDMELPVRRTAASALLTIGPKADDAVPALGEALGDKETVIRSLAAKALGKVGTEAKPALPKVAAALKDKIASVRISAALALWQIDRQTSGVPALIDGLKDDDLFHREQACLAVAELGLAAKEAAPAIFETLKDKDAKIRALSAAALGKMPGVKGGYLKLAATLEDADAEVRLAAARALWTAEPKTAEVTVQVIINVLKDKPSRARVAAAQLLGEIGAAAKAAVPALITAIRDESVAVRQAAALALKKIDPDAAAKAGIR